MTQPPSFSPDPSRRRPSSDEVRPADTADIQPTQSSPQESTLKRPIAPTPAEQVQRHSVMPPAPADSPSETISLPANLAPSLQPPTFAPTGRPRSYPPATGQGQSTPPGPQQAPTAPPQAPTLPRTPQGPPQVAPRPRKKRRWRRWALLMVILLIGWPLFLLWDANSNLNRLETASTAEDTPGETWLIAGSDSRADGEIADGTEGARADSIMLVNIAPNGQTAMLSLPRDTWVEIPDYGGDKLNSAYAYGGPELLISTVESLTGLKIDHYAEIGMGGVGNIVDAVGGVELCFDMDVDDEKSQLKWTAGCHQADGNTALAFARMRYADPRGDIGRADRQRQVVQRTTEKATSPLTLINPFSAFALERAGAKALTVDSDDNVIDVGRLVFAVKGAQGGKLTGTPPIASPDFETSAGSAVLLQDETAPDFFASLREGTLTPEDFQQLEVPQE
ncbi:MAG: LCP family protein [Actinomycetaceae bacterium]|nr:LCP family protein [Actinomycetaceae bacterium]